MFIFIVNPKAGKGFGEQIYQQIVLDYAEIFTLHKVFFTKGKGHAREIICNLKNIDDFEAIIVIGGDGTLHEVVDGIAGRQLPIVLLSAGSGNDFRRGVDLPRDYESVIENALIKNNQLSFWTGSYQRKSIKEGSFINCLGFGFDAVVAKKANELKTSWQNKSQLINKFVYIIAFLMTIFANKRYALDVELDGETYHFSECLFLVINNQPYFGGGMKINPLASNKPDKFSIVVINSIPLWKIIFFFGTIFTGQHLRFKEVSTYFASEITVSSKEMIPFQADGETGLVDELIIRKNKQPIIVKGTKSND